MKTVSLFLIFTLVFAGCDYGKKEAYGLIECPALTDVSLRPFGEIAFNGSSEEVKNGSFDDAYLYDEEHRVRVATRHQWGDTLIYFGEESNTLDDSDATRGLQMIFHDEKRPRWELRQSHNDPLKTHLRIQQSLRFVKSHVLEVEALVTNLDNTPLTAHHEFPLLNASRVQHLTLLKNADGDAFAEGRLPATSNRPVRDPMHAPGGWITYQSSDNRHGVGLYWENRNENIHAEPSSELNSVRSDFTFTIPPNDTVRARFYLLLGGYEQIRGLAETLDHTLPPFGRIDTHRIEEDTRTVTLSGWVLDNKGVSAVELWVNGKKSKDIALNVAREDICTTYPGYTMCTQGKNKIGFETTYTRPAGEGCERPVEIRARDSDGNWRTIARKGILPVQYATN